MVPVLAPLALVLVLPAWPTLSSVAPAPGAVAVSLAAEPSPAAASPAPPPDLPHAFDAGWRGERVCTVLFEDPAVRVARCTFPPGVGHEKHYHRPHFGYVLEGGTMRIEDADGVVTVETDAGGHWSSDEVTVHEVVNVGETTTSYLIVEPRAID